MKPLSSPTEYDRLRGLAPQSVRVLSILGHGRAAQAKLVEATLPSGKVETVVEKVFAPGLLTRTVYRLSFQAPFAYQSNYNAIATCFYRRRVAAAVIACGDTQAKVAAPLYVRYDAASRAWVLAAQWIQGRGIRPLAADPHRIASLLGGRVQERFGEIDELVETMGSLESCLVDSGLIGSGWQVAPRAMVSSANLLRTGDHYTIIDLESGIPAVLVPKYIGLGLRSGTAPPFDDLDADRLRQWYRENERLLRFRLSLQANACLESDIECLIAHSEAWKASELALFRRPWRLVTRGGLSAYQIECVRQWNQNGTVDDATFAELVNRPIKRAMIWWSGLMPGSIGRGASRVIGNRDVRERMIACLRDPKRRMETGKRILTQLTIGRLPHRVRRFFGDPNYRRDTAIKTALLVGSPAYQAFLGQRHVEASIDSWLSKERITSEEADRLRCDLSGDEVRAYVRGFGLHLSLKVLSPVLVPAKIGSAAALLTTGNPWFLIPLVVMPAVRFLIALASWIQFRHRAIPHGEAMLVSPLPVVGPIAFPLQMFSLRPTLSSFLIRDAAGKIGRRLPIYGGPDSRTELALIGWSDYLIEIMSWLSRQTGKVIATTRKEPLDTVADVISIPNRSRLRRWIDRNTERCIGESIQRDRPEPEVTRSSSKAA